MQSAKTNLNVNEVFFSIGKDIKQRLADRDARAKVRMNLRIYFHYHHHILQLGQNHKFYYVYKTFKTFCFFFFIL